MAEHLLFFETDGNRLRGTHQGERGEGELSGTMDGSKVSFRSRLVHRGEHSGYSFSGTLSGGDRIFGEVSLGEYGTARFTARRRSA